MKIGIKIVLLVVYFILLVAGFLALQMSEAFSGSAGGSSWLSYTLLLGPPLLGALVVLAGVFKDLRVEAMFAPVGLCLAGYAGVYIHLSSKSQTWRTLPLQANERSYRCSDDVAITIPEYVGPAPVYLSRRNPDGSSGGALVGHAQNQKFTLEKWVARDEAKLNELRALIESKTCKNSEGKTVDTVLAELVLPPE
ncbi:MAG TPA: hypothetical protein VFV50_13300 [Bdellovibrionales bacterium]|nr:hypothetical protein [Bdellovibrionales bacterium]